MSLLQFWRKVFWEALIRSFETIGKDPAELVFAIVIFILVGVFLIYRRGWPKGSAEMIAKLPKALGEDIAIVASVFVLILIYQMVLGAYREWKNADDKAIAIKGDFDSYKLTVEKTKPDFEAKLFRVAAGPAGGGKDLMVIVTGNIRNHGTPGTVDEIWVDLEVDDSRIIHGKFPLSPSPKDTIGVMPHLFLGGDTFWMRKARERPILTDTRVDGWVLAVFQGITVEEAIQKKAVVIFTASDMTGKKFSSKWTLLPPDEEKPFTIADIQKPRH